MLEVTPVNRLLVIGAPLVLASATPVEAQFSFTEQTDLLGEVSLRQHFSVGDGPRHKRQIGMWFGMIKMGVDFLSL